jgi:hypothetical protein
MAKIVSRAINIRSKRHTCPRVVTLQIRQYFIIPQTKKLTQTCSIQHQLAIQSVQPIVRFNTKQLTQQIAKLDGLLLRHRRGRNARCSRHCVYIVIVN